MATSPSGGMPVYINYIGEFVEDASNFKPIPKPHGKANQPHSREEKPKNHKQDAKKPKRRKGN